MKTTARLTVLGLSTVVVGCQSADKDYYQPHSHYGATVQQVPHAYSTRPAPAQSTPYHSPSTQYSQPQSRPVLPPPAPAASPQYHQSRPTLIAPPGSNGPMPPMAPPAVPGVAPYGAPNPQLRPVPAPTSWIPGPNGGLMPAGYMQAPHLQGAWVPQQQTSWHGAKGLITPDTPRSGVNSYLPVRFNSPAVTQNSSQTLFGPGWRDRQANGAVQPPQITTPWQAALSAANPVSLHQIVVPSPVSPQSIVLNSPPNYDQDRFKIAPPASELVEDWPLKVDTTEVDQQDAFEPDADAVEAFVKEQLPLIQPEIRHRLHKAPVLNDTILETAKPEVARLEVIESEEVPERPSSSVPSLELPSEPGQAGPLLPSFN